MNKLSKILFTIGMVICGFEVIFSVIFSAVMITAATKLYHEYVDGNIQISDNKIYYDGDSGEFEIEVEDNKIILKDENGNETSIDTDDKEALNHFYDDLYNDIEDKYTDNSGNTL